VEFEREISVIVARNPYASDEQTRVYGPFENEHASGILRRTTFPIHVQSGMRQEHRLVAERAIEIGKVLAHALRSHGLLAVELFVTSAGEVIFNEIAPRPHNSGHLTIECFETSQFEQYVRAACNLPWGSMAATPGIMHNVIGADAQSWEMLTGEDGALHLYGKDGCAPGRKMGHVTFRGRRLQK
jgi:5-(carboxyamino)imidazole ribonucleotide synthase